MSTYTRRIHKDFDQALAEIRSGKYTIRYASRLYSIPSSTLHDHISGRVLPASVKGQQIRKYTRKKKHWNRVKPQSSPYRKMLAQHLADIGNPEVMTVNSNCDIPIAELEDEQRKEGSSRKQTVETTFSMMMHAVQVTKFGGPKVLVVYSDVPIPEPEDDQVLIKVEAAGVNPVDTYIRTGTYHVKPDLPYIPGSDVAGTVQKTGPNVTLFKPGDRVFTVRTVSGGYAEYSVASETTTFTLPSQLSFTDGASLGVPAFTAYRAFYQKAHPRPGETILVHGASGAVGLLACQMAKAQGLTVIGTAGSAEGLQVVKEKTGAHFVFNHKGKNYMDKITEASGGEGVDIILEMLANVNLEKDLQMMRKNGRVVIIGSRGTLEVTPRLAMTKDLSIHGMLLFNASPEDWKEMRAGVGAHLEHNVIRPVIAHEYSLDEAEQVHRDVIKNVGSKGKLVINMQK